MLLLMLISFSVAFLCSGLICKKFRFHSKYFSINAPQNFHSGIVPRLGGLGVLAGWSIAVTLSVVMPILGFFNALALLSSDYFLFLLLAIAAAIVGAIEDIFQRVPVLLRLFVSGALGVVAVSFWGLYVPSVGIPLLDQYWQTTPLLGMALAAFAIMGLPHAFNIIDGYNGLAGTVSMLVCFALAHVCLQVGDRELAMVILCFAAATAGFLIWNYPRGLVFAGDGGAYLWGIVIALVSIALVQRHPQVSPWFPMLLLIYPVWETFFSIYRKFSRGESPGMADALHLHQLVYRRLVKQVIEPEEGARLLARNNKTMPYLATLTLMSVLPAMLFWSNTRVLQLLVLLFVLTYVYGYTRIVRFKVPRWMRR
jgi:UDP-N-acetylmuramyl pentapeptide phosphotransferase/UDP-N-acetylglucosamine-1-phosphate transferase